MAEAAPPIPSPHTVVLSDLHLADEAVPQPKRPLWKAYKRREHFVDGDVVRLLEYMEQQVDGPVELVLNGDVFDFDDVMGIPDEPEGPVDWLAKLRGLGSEEWMSRFKMECIIENHREWFQALGHFARRGNPVVFVLGNHDLELHWPSVQRLILAAMESPDGDEAETDIRFCHWFYMSGGDTFISHGSQYDPYCVIRDPIYPIIQGGGRPRVRLPFGDIADRYLLNGMGYFNPHAVENYIMSALEYARFFRKYMLTTQPFLLWTWFWSAIVTLWRTLDDYWRPVMRDPLLVDEKVQDVADRAKVTPSVVRKLSALHEPSASARPISLVRELWLDRGLLLLAVIFVAWQVVSTINWIAPISIWWLALPAALLMPLFFLYSFSVHSAVFKRPLLSPERAKLINEITGAHMVVFGHTHEPQRAEVGPVLYLNGGFWSPAFAEPECRNRIGTQTFVWIRPVTGDQKSGAAARRNAEIFEWPPRGEGPKPWDPETLRQLTPALGHLPVAETES